LTKSEEHTMQATVRRNEGVIGKWTDGLSRATGEAVVRDLRQFEGLGNGLDWQRFSAAYFPGRRRHDLQALTAYSAYKRSRDTGTRSPAESGGTETGRGKTGATALRNWEDEGGATLSPNAP
jgi:hypothetical protein